MIKYRAEPDAQCVAVLELRAIRPCVLQVPRRCCLLPAWTLSLKSTVCWQASTIVSQLNCLAPLPQLAAAAWAVFSCLSANILRAGAAAEALHTEPVTLDAAILLLLVVPTLQQRIPQRGLVVPREVVPDARQQQRAGAAGGQRPVSLQ